MALLAAPGDDTWGISGPAFLFIYFVAAIVLLLIAMLHRALLFAGRHDLAPEQLDPQQAAYLSGRDRLAIYAALGYREFGALEDYPPGQTRYFMRKRLDQNSPLR